MSHQALSELYILPPKQTLDASYYVSEILAKTCKDALKRKWKQRLFFKGEYSQTRLKPDWSKVVPQLTERNLLKNGVGHTYKTSGIKKSGQEIAQTWTQLKIFGQFSNRSSTRSLN